jgi:hypothetical protein
MASNILDNIFRRQAADPFLSPLPAHVGNQFSLRYHIALEAMRMGKGSAAISQALLEMVMTAGLLADRGHGLLDYEQTRNAQGAIAKATTDGLKTKQWCLPQDGFDALCALATEHDIQLRHAPAVDVIDVLGHVKKLSSWAANQSKRS